MPIVGVAAAIAQVAISIKSMDQQRKLAHQAQDSAEEAQKALLDLSRENAAGQQLVNEATIAKLQAEQRQTDTITKALSMSQTLGTPDNVTPLPASNPAPSVATVAKQTGLTKWLPVILLGAMAIVLLLVFRPKPAA